MITRTFKETRYIVKYYDFVTDTVQETIFVTVQKNEKKIEKYLTKTLEEQKRKFISMEFESEKEILCKMEDLDFYNNSIKEDK